MDGTNVANVMSLTKPKLIGICGLAGAGKSTVAQMLGSDFGYVRTRFADPLKTMLRAIGLTDLHIEGGLKEKPCDLLSGRTPRHAMQTLGTEWGRQYIGPNFWVNLWRARARSEFTRGLRVVVEDLRFPQELAAVLAEGGTVWRVERAGLTAGQHASEQFVAEMTVDHVIDNSQDFAELGRKISQLVSV